MPACPSAQAEAAEVTLPLTPLEALHVRAPLSRALERLSLVGALNADAAGQAAELSQSVGDEIARVVAQQRALEAQFEELVGAQAELRRQPNKARAAENEAQLTLVSEALRGATQQLCRSLKDNLNVGDNMGKISQQRAGVASLLSATLRALAPASPGGGDGGGGGGGGGGPLPSVLPVVEAVLAFDHEEARARELSDAERAAAAAVRQLRQDLRDEKAAHDEAMHERRLALAAVKEQLRTDKLRLAVEGRYHEKDLAAANQAARRLQRAELASMVDALSSLRQQVEIERSVGAAAGEHLARAAAARQDDAVGWGSRREEDAHARERQVEIVRGQMQRDAMRLKDLEGRLGEEQELKAKRDEAAHDAAEAVEREATDAVRRLRAAVKIQAAWRGFKARRGLQSGGRGKKKGAAAKRKGKK